MVTPLSEVTVRYRPGRCATPAAQTNYAFAAA